MSAEQRPVCEKCKTKTYPGEEYTMYYGTYYSGLDVPHTKLLGKSTLFLCDRCVAQKSNGENSWGELIMIVLGVLGVSAGLGMYASMASSNSTDVESLLIGIGGTLAGILFITGGFLLYRSRSKLLRAITKGDKKASRQFKQLPVYKDVGDRLVIQLLRTKSSPNQKGVTVYHTRSEYASRNKTNQYF